MTCLLGKRRVETAQLFPLFHGLEKVKQQKLAYFELFHRRSSETVCETAESLGKTPKAGETP
jgi:hypothetical protein